MDEIKITSVDGGAINEAEYNRCPECLTGFADMPCFGRRGMGDREDSDADDADDADDDVVLCLYHRYQIGVQEGSNGQTNVPRTSVSEGSIRHYDARSRLLPSPFMGRYSWYTASQPRDHLSRRLASTGQAVPVCIPLMMSFSRTGGEFFKVLPDLQPIPSCWERPRRLPRRASGHLHLEREFLICFTPPRHLGKGGGGGGGCGRGQRNLTLITPAAQSAPRPQSVFHPSWLPPRCRPSIFGFVFVHRAIKIHSRVCQQRIPVDNTGGRPNHACEWFSATIRP